MTQEQRLRIRLTPPPSFPGGRFWYNWRILPLGILVFAVTLPWSKRFPSLIAVGSISIHEDDFSILWKRMLEKTGLARASNINDSHVMSHMNMIVDVAVGLKVLSAVLIVMSILLLSKRLLLEPRHLRLRPRINDCEEFVITISSVGVQILHSGADQQTLIPIDCVVDVQVQEIIDVHRVYTSVHVFYQPSPVPSPKNGGDVVLREASMDLFPHLELTFQECQEICVRLRAMLKLQR